MIPDFDAAHRQTDSKTLRTAVGTLRAQEAKGRGKYGTDLDGAGLDALQLLTHATEEAADLLMYLTALGDRAAVLEASEREWYVRWKAAAEAIDERDTLTARVAELEAEVARLRALNPLDWQTAGTGSGDLRGQGLQP